MGMRCFPFQERYVATGCHPLPRVQFLLVVLLLGFHFVPPQLMLSPATAGWGQTYLFGLGQTYELALGENL